MGRDDPQAGPPSAAKPHGFGDNGLTCSLRP